MDFLTFPTTSCALFKQSKKYVLCFKHKILKGFVHDSVLRIAQNIQIFGARLGLSLSYLDSEISRSVVGWLANFAKLDYC